MTPLENAVNLISEFQIYENMSKHTLCKHNSNDCALIVARHVSYSHQLIEAELSSLNGCIGIDSYFNERHLFWAEVIKEIKNQKSV